MSYGRDFPPGFCRYRPHSDVTRAEVQDESVINKKAAPGSKEFLYVFTLMKYTIKDGSYQQEISYLAPKYTKYWISEWAPRAYDFVRPKM